VACQSVRTAERDHAERGCRLAAFRDKPLKNFMNGAVASAGEDDVRAAADSFPGLDGGGAGSCGGHEFYALAKSRKSLSDLAELLWASMPIAAGGRVIDEDTAHAIILPWSCGNKSRSVESPNDKAQGIPRSV
jgi:hypothetical protein